MSSAGYWKRRGLVLVVSAPSGAGKRTILSHVQRRDPKLVYAVSATTRPPRKDEVDGLDYHFLEEEIFLAQRDAGAFAEWAEVHGNYYGTPLADLKRLIATGKDVLVEVDVQGMRQLRGASLDIVSVFIMPPSLEELEARLKRRGENTPADQAVRLQNAREELAARFEYDYIVVNRVLEDAVGDIEAIVRAERCRANRINKDLETDENVIS